MSENNMNEREMLELLAKLRKARADELKAFKKAWPNPTPKQAKRIEKLQREYNDFTEKYRTLKNIVILLNLNK